MTYQEGAALEGIRRAWAKVERQMSARQYLNAADQSIEITGLLLTALSAVLKEDPNEQAPSEQR